MTWNYRVVRGADDGGPFFSIHAAYYEEPSQRLMSLALEPRTPRGSTLDELRGDLLAMIEALDEPVLDDERT